MSKNKKKLYGVLVRLKRYLNLSRTMNFVPDFHHGLSIGPVWDKIHGLRQIQIPF